MKSKDLLKKVICFALVGTMLISSSACSSSSSDTSSESSTESSIGEDEEVVVEDSEVSEETTDETSESSTEESTESSETPIDGESMPAPDAGDEDFQTAFSGNAIDTDYLTAINAATDTVSSVRAGNNAKSRWSTQIEISLDTLKELDESVYEEQEQAQEEWEANLDSAIEEVKANISTDGSLGNVESAYNVMLLYRNRAAEVLYQIYLINGEVDVNAGVGEAEG